MTPKKKINKLIQQENHKLVVIWGILSQKKSHLLVKEISDVLDVEFEFNEKKEFYIFSHQQMHSHFYLIKNPKIDFFKEIDVDYLFILPENQPFDNIVANLFHLLKDKQYIQGTYPLKISNKFYQKIFNYLEFR